MRFVHPFPPVAPQGRSSGGNMVYQVRSAGWKDPDETLGPVEPPAKPKRTTGTVTIEQAMGW